MNTNKQKERDLIIEIDNQVSDLWFDHLEGWSTVGTPPWSGEGPKGPVQYIAFTNAREGDDDPYQATGWTPTEALKNLLKVLKNLKLPNMPRTKIRKEKANPLFTDQEQANYEEGQYALQESMKPQTANTDKPMEGLRSEIENIVKSNHCRYCWRLSEKDLGVNRCVEDVEITVEQLETLIQQAIEEERERILEEGKKQENERLWKLAVNMENPYEKNVKLFLKTYYFLGFERCRAMLLGELLNSNIGPLKSAGTKN